MLRLIIVLIVFGIVLYGLSLIAPDISQSVYDIAINRAPSPSVGLMASVLSAIASYIYVYITQNKDTDGENVLRYRTAELVLIRMGKMKAEDILQYHSQYSWNVYAGLSFSTVFIIVPLFLSAGLGESGGGSGSSGEDPIKALIIFFGLSLMVISAVLLAMTDLFHTNTLTPLITTERRFRLISFIINLGGAAIVLQVCAMGAFVALINSWLSVVSAMTALALTIFMTRQRGISIEQIIAERKLEGPEVEMFRKALSESARGAPEAPGPPGT